MSQIIDDVPESFDGTWNFHPKFNHSSGFKMHYIDEGTGPETLLLLHGEPTWSYLFRQQITEWSKHYRVIAVDHMGFGKSDTPQDRTYWLQDHIDNLERFVLNLKLSNLTLVMHDFGGPVGMGFTIRHPPLVKRLISINAPLPAGQPDLAKQLISNASHSPWFQWILKANDEGILKQVLRQLDYNILSTLKLNGFERNEIISDSWIRAYASPFQNYDDCLGAIGWAEGFAANEHRFEAPDEYTKRLISEKQALTIWGEKDKTLDSGIFLGLFRQIFPQGKTHVLPDVGHYSPEDAPDIISQLVVDFIDKE